MHLKIQLYLYFFQNCLNHYNDLNFINITKISYVYDESLYVDANFKLNGTFKILEDNNAAKIKIIIGQTILPIDWYTDYTVLRNIEYGFLYCTNVSSGSSKYLNGTNIISGLSASKGQTIIFFGVFIPVKEE